MQPTFLPWLGYFALIDSVDIFVLLDDVQFTSTGFQNRNRIKTSQGPLTITVPCSRGMRPICEVEVVSTTVYKKLLRTVSQSYSKATYNHEIISLLDHVFARNHQMLSNLNCELIYEISKKLNIDTTLVRSSELKIPHEDKRIRLLSFCESLNANQYISVLGSLSYLRDNNPFASSDTELSFFSFEHPTYSQLHGEFKSHLSVIDALANIGEKETLNILRSSTKPELSFDQAIKKYP